MGFTIEELLAIQDCLNQAMLDGFANDPIMSDGLFDATKDPILTAYQKITDQLEQQKES